MALWISPLFGEPGFALLLDEQSLAMTASPRQGDRWADHLRQNPTAGLLAIDFARRARLRINGDAKLGDRGLTLRTREFFGNCPQYIQARELAQAPRELTQAEFHTSAALTPEQSRWISLADTCFLGTLNPSTGADSSHRGGRPGFVHADSSTRLLIPDYSGNNMFQTLGNIHANPRAAVLFIDFQSGATLQLGGVATILWDSPRQPELRGARRLVQFDIREVVEIKPAQPLRWQFLEASPLNP